MATTKDFHDYILECLQGVGKVTTKKMMGEYLLYFNQKLIGNICDNCLFLKPTESVLCLMPTAKRSYPYEGSKTLMVIVEDAADTELMSKVIHAMYKELPEEKDIMNKKTKNRIN